MSTPRPTVPGTVPDTCRQLFELFYEFDARVDELDADHVWLFEEILPRLYMLAVHSIEAWKYGPRCRSCSTGTGRRPRRPGGGA